MPSSTSQAAPPPQTLEQWVDQNPLRAWRLSHKPKKVSILSAAGALGVGTSMLQMYERGVHRPGADKHPKFAELLGEDWLDRWEEWLSQRPAGV